MDAIIIVVSRPMPGEAELAVFVAGKSQPDYGLLVTEHSVGSELFALIRQYREQGNVEVVADRRHQAR